MSANFMNIDGYVKDIAATATPVDAIPSTGAKPKYARDLVIRCPAGNTTDIKVGSRARQEFTIAKGTSERLSTIMNNMSQSGKFILAEIFVKAGTNGDDVEFLAIEPSDE